MLNLIRQQLLIMCKFRDYFSTAIMNYQLIIPSINPIRAKIIPYNQHSHYSQFLFSEL